MTVKLINTHGYNGLIITDGFEMNAVKNRFTSTEAAVQAIKASCDMICVPYNMEEAIGGVLDAVEHGEISQTDYKKICPKGKTCVLLHFLFD